MELLEVRKELEGLQEGEYKKFSSSLIPGVKNMLGIRLPILRKIAKRIAKEDYRSCLAWENLIYFEEIMLQAMVLGYAKAPIEQLLEDCKNFIPKIDNWSVNDTFCNSFKIATKERDAVWKFLMQYKDSKEEFEVRVVAVMLRSHFLVEDYIDKVLKVLGSLEVSDYYASMGVAWAYATAWAKFPKKTKKYLVEHPIDAETYHKTLRKCLESYRITPEDKLWIRNQLKYDKEKE